MSKTWCGERLKACIDSWCTKAAISTCVVTSRWQNTCYKHSRWLYSLKPTWQLSRWRTTCCSSEYVSYSHFTYFTLNKYHIVFFDTRMKLYSLILFLTNTTLFKDLGSINKVTWNLSHRLAVAVIQSFLITQNSLLRHYLYLSSFFIRKNRVGKSALDKEGSLGGGRLINKIGLQVVGQHEVGAVKDSKTLPNLLDTAYLYHT